MLLRMFYLQFWAINIMLVCIKYEIHTIALTRNKLSMLDCNKCSNKFNFNYKVKASLYWGGKLVCANCHSYLKQNWLKEGLSIFSFLFILLPSLIFKYKPELSMSNSIYIFLGCFLLCAVGMYTSNQMEEYLFFEHDGTRLKCAKR